jgi:hypothetical protein
MSVSRDWGSARSLWLDAKTWLSSQRPDPAPPEVPDAVAVTPKP